MLIYITPVGSGKTLKKPIGNNKYSGIIGIVEESQKYGRNYRGKCELDQDKLFDLIYNYTKYKIKDTIVIEPKLSLYHIGNNILSKLTHLIKHDQKIKFHIEISSGYKELSHILVLLSQIISENIEKITFTQWNGFEQIFPVSKIHLTKEQFGILKGFEIGLKSHTFNGKIISNPYVAKNIKNRKYIYRILKQAKNTGILKEDNTFTDFGKLILKFYKI